mmetsp:Transcript_12706/g.33673  ORF Transcript_12706/g.33673 Transcript_12706/m.33673 type:complete len:514 (-) Transcript_12706:115-1656(-)
MGSAPSSQRVQQRIPEARAVVIDHSTTHPTGVAKRYTVPTRRQACSSEEEEHSAPPNRIDVRSDKAIYVSAALTQDFVLSTTLGQGSFGKVKLVKDRRTRATYASKIFYKITGAGARGGGRGGYDKKSVKNEAIVMNSLRHPQLVSLYAVYDDEYQTSFVMEYCRGGDLRQLLHGKDLKPVSKAAWKPCGSPPSPSSAPEYMCNPSCARAPLLSSTRRTFNCDDRGPSPDLHSNSTENTKLPPIPNNSTALAAKANWKKKSESEKQLRRGRSNAGAGSLPFLSLQAPSIATDTDSSKHMLTDPMYVHEEDAAAVFCDIVAGLAYMHSLNIAHRDVKLENIYMRHPQVASASLRDNDFVLGDFGFSAQPGFDGKFHSLCGSPVYMAPEVVGKEGARTRQEAVSAKERAYDTKCDVWSAGVVLYFLLTGEYPFIGQKASETFVYIVHAPLRFPKSQVLRLSPSAVSLLLALLDKDPSSRPTAADILLHDPWLRSCCPDRVDQRLVALGWDSSNST